MLFHCKLTASPPRIATLEPHPVCEFCRFIESAWARLLWLHVSNIKIQYNYKLKLLLQLGTCVLMCA